MGEMCPVSVSCMVDLAEEKDAPVMGLEERNASEEKDAPEEKKEAKYIWSFVPYEKGEEKDALVKEKIPDEKDLPEKEGVASKVCRDAESPCMGQENYDICISLLERGCPENKIVYMEMCPVSVSCMVDLAEEKDAPVKEKIPDEKDLPEKEGVASEVCRDAESPC